MSQPATRPMTVEQFFAWQARQEERYELVDGRPVPRAMTGATRRHDLVVVNALAALRPRLRGGPCLPTTADVAVATRAGQIRRPDLTVDCSPMMPGALTASEPVLVLEVLSPSTERVDTIVKLDEYRAVPTLRHILIAEPGAAHVLLYSRVAGGAWTSLDHIGLDTVLELPALSCTLPLAELYEGVPLEGDEAGS